MAFYKRRVVVQDTPAMVREREVRAAVRDQVSLMMKARYPDLGQRAYTVDEFNEMLTWQADLMARLERQSGVQLSDN